MTSPSGVHRPSLTVLYILATCLRYYQHHDGVLFRYKEGTAPTLCIHPLQETSTTIIQNSYVDCQRKGRCQLGGAIPIGVLLTTTTRAWLGPEAGVKATLRHLGVQNLPAVMYSQFSLSSQTMHPQMQIGEEENRLLMSH
jgi:hypothetical protein